jgi:hypothetical protein
LRTTKKQGAFIKEACECSNGLKGFRIVKHTIHDQIKNWNKNLKDEDHPIFHSEKLKKRQDKNKVLSLYLIKILTMKFGLDEEKALKCSKAPIPVLERVMQLCQSIVSGNKSIMELKVLENWLCKELRIIPTALADRSVYKSIKSFLGKYFTATKRTLK